MKKSQDSVSYSVARMAREEGKTATGGDIFVDVADKGFQMSLTSSVPEGIVNATTGAVTFTMSTTPGGFARNHCQRQGIENRLGRHLSYRLIYFPLGR